MHELLINLASGFTPTGSLNKDVPTFLNSHKLPKTAAHCQAVANKAREIALQFGEDENAAEAAGWLHDISAVIPTSERAQAAGKLGIPVLPEEAAFPMILHQKISVELAKEIFGVDHQAVLSAVGCHTTLKANASRLDMVVFTADKISWDQSGNPPYLEAVLAGLEKSLDAGVLVYLTYMWERKDSLQVLHPWLAAAYTEISAIE